MGALGAVDLQAADTAHIVHGVGQVQGASLDEGAGLGAARFGGVGAQEEVAAPKGAQIEAQPALDVHEEHAAALLLQDLLTVGRFQREVGGQAVVVPGVGLHAPECPAAKTAEGEHGQQLVEVGEQRAQGARGAAGELVDQGQVLAQQVVVAQPSGGGGQAVEE